MHLCAGARRTCTRPRKGEIIRFVSDFDGSWRRGEKREKDRPDRISLDGTYAPKCTASPWKRIISNGKICREIYGRCEIAVDWHGPVSNDKLLRCWATARSKSYKYALRRTTRVDMHGRTKLMGSFVRMRFIMQNSAVSRTVRGILNGISLPRALLHLEINRMNQRISDVRSQAGSNAEKWAIARVIKKIEILPSRGILVALAINREADSSKNGNLFAYSTHPTHIVAETAQPWTRAPLEAPVNKCKCILSGCAPGGRCRDRVTVARFDLNSSRARRRPHINLILLTGRYAEQRRRRRRRGRRRGRRYSSCNGVNYRRRTVPWHLQHHRSFHGQVHWFQLHRRSRRLQQKVTCSSAAGNYH